jgi:hypothetical protein
MLPPFLPYVVQVGIWQDHTRPQLITRRLVIARPLLSKDNGFGTVAPKSGVHFGQPSETALARPLKDGTNRTTRDPLHLTAEHRPAGTQTSYCASRPAPRRGWNDPQTPIVARGFGWPLSVRGFGWRDFRRA